MTPAAIAILICLILVVLFGSRNLAATAMLAGVLYLTQAQRIEVGGLHFFAFRFIEIAGSVRCIAKGEFGRIRFNDIDKGFMGFQIALLIITLVRLFIHPSSIESPAFRMAYFFDGMTSYFIFRALLADPQSFRNFFEKSAYVILPFAILMVLESKTGGNLFSFMGGTTPGIRHGHYRALLTFGSSNTAGSFGAGLFPLFVVFVMAYGRRAWNIIGAVACVMITMASHSGGPMAGFAAGILALFFWRVRRHMRMVRWGIVISAVFLQLIMKAPIWFALAHLSEITGGHGWDRAALIDKFVHHFHNWWLMGMPLENTANWAATREPNGAVDVVNGYVKIGIAGGLISLILFIQVLVRCFRSLGASMHLIRSKGGVHMLEELLLWGLGCSLFCHVVNIIGVSYFDQSRVIWYMTLAVISSQTAYYLNAFQTDDLSPGYGRADGHFNVEAESYGL